MVELWKKWKKVPSRNRFLIQLIVFCFMVSGFALLYQPVLAKYFEAKGKISRIVNRTESRAEIKGLGKLSSLPPKVLERQIRSVEEQAEVVKAEFNELDTGFAPMDSAEMRQQLMLEISALAERAGIELLRVSRKGFRPEGGETVLVIDKELGRPLLLLTANATFDQLLGFLDGLKELSFYVSVMKMSLYSRLLDPASIASRGGNRNLRGMNTSGYVPPGAIFVSLELSI